jgi:hypothetical protein
MNRGLTPPARQKPKPHPRRRLREPRATASVLPDALTYHPFTRACADARAMRNGAAARGCGIALTPPIERRKLEMPLTWSHPT